MVEVLTQLVFYADWPKAWDAFYMAKENNCDFIVALGGGSVMDAFAAQCELNNEDCTKIFEKSYR